MKNNYWRNSLVVAGLCGVALTCTAAPLKRTDLPADPTWVVHIDIDALKTTTIGEFITGELDKPEVKDKLAAMQQMFSFDIQKQLHGVSLYSTSMKQEDGVLIVYADIQPDNLVTLVKGAEEYQGLEHKGHTIHSWIDKNRHFGPGNGNQRTFAAIQGSRLIFGQSKATVASALDVIDGGPNLATSKNFAQLGRGKSSFIQAAARKLDLNGNDPGAQMFKMAKSLQLEVAEMDAKLIAVVALTANDEESANNITQMAQGLLALVKMQKDNPQAAKFTDALSIKQEGNVTTASIKIASADLIDMAKSAGDHHAPRRKDAPAKEN
jgi:hypothetical protein